MAEAKTKPTQVSVADFIAAVEPASKREDATVLDALFRKVTGVEPEMWGPTIIGYGEYHTVYDSGRKVRCCRAGFSPRKAKHSLYLLPCDDAGNKADYDALFRALASIPWGREAVCMSTKWPTSI